MLWQWKPFTFVTGKSWTSFMYILKA
jgi:hypothetical protein